MNGKFTDESMRAERNRIKNGSGAGRILSERERNCKLAYDKRWSACGARVTEPVRNSERTKLAAQILRKGDGTQTL